MHRGLQQKVQLMPVEGHSGGLELEPQMYYWMVHALTEQGCIKHICDTGFKAGHSALRCLLAAPHAQVHMFDL